MIKAIIILSLLTAGLLTGQIFSLKRIITDKKIIKAQRESIAGASKLNTAISQAEHKAEVAKNEKDPSKVIANLNADN